MYSSRAVAGSIEKPKKVRQRVDVRNKRADERVKERERSSLASTPLVVSSNEMKDRVS